MDFLQSSEWRKFQESVGRKTYEITSPQPPPYKGEGDFEFSASIVEHELPVVGKYFYIPRGPAAQNTRYNIQDTKKIQNSCLPAGTAKFKNFFSKLIELARENKAGWIRFDPESDEMLKLIRKYAGADLVSAQKGQAQGLSLQKYKIAKAPHDMQPKEIFTIDITKSEEQLLAEMKSKTRYNIRLAEKKGVNVYTITNNQETRNRQISNETKSQKLKAKSYYVDEFIKLTKIMAKRQGISVHPEQYYQKMFETLPSDILKLYVAEYENKIIAANLMVFYGDTATYLHGASDDQFRNVMAPYLLQWRAIQDAKKMGCQKYDFGGISTNYESHTNIRITNKWQGITRFKLGFSPDTSPVKFPGSYDIIISPIKYWTYQSIQRLKSLIR